jgi:hypothetical protein
MSGWWFDRSRNLFDKMPCDIPGSGCPCVDGDRSTLKDHRPCGHKGHSEVISLFSRFLDDVA